MYSFQSFRVWNLYEKLGAPEFGLICQATLTICFKSFGADIESLKQTGHPDIEFGFNDKHWRVEVEFVSPQKDTFEVKDEDIQATRPLSELDVGYFAIFDCNYPVSWKLIDVSKIMLIGKGFHPLNKLDSLSNVDLSALCTAWTSKFLEEHESEIVCKRFPGICKDYIFG